MTSQEQINYQRIERAIDYLRENLKNPPSLEALAQTVNMSPYHFQRMFTRWAGISPKKFTQFVRIEYAKSLLTQRRASIMQTAHDIGLSGSGRLHDLFVNIEGMTPGEFKNGGANLVIHYQFADSLFGELLIASTAKGICHLFFVDDHQQALVQLKTRFPNATLKQASDSLQVDALSFFSNLKNTPNKLNLHLSGTAFQIKVWQCLLHIPLGQVATYGDIAEQVCSKKAARAVGSAIGKNPIAYLIPCHRVIRGDGQLGGYMWGGNRKRAVLGWEAAQVNAGHLEPEGTIEG